MGWLYYLFGAYLIGCYFWATYLVVRLYTGKRLRVLLFGSRQVTDETPLTEPAFNPAPSQHTTTQPTHQRAAA